MSNDLDLTAAQHADFHRGFIAALLWSESRGEDAEEGDLDDNYGHDDIHPSTQDALRAQCATFGRENARDLTDAAEQVGYSMERAGHDFALSRNGHGAGFFDRDLGEVGDRLQAAAQAAGEIDLYVGDDGIVYASGLEPAAPTTGTRKPRP